MIAWQGALLWVLGSTGTINLRDSFITGIAGTFFKEAWVGMLLGAALVTGYAAVQFLDRRRRLAAGLPAASAQTLLVACCAGGRDCRWSVAESSTRIAVCRWPR